MLELLDEPGIKLTLSDGSICLREYTFPFYNVSTASITFTIEECILLIRRKNCIKNDLKKAFKSFKPFRFSSISFNGKKVSVVIDRVGIVYVEFSTLTDRITVLPDLWGKIIRGFQIFPLM